ncbi:nitroreductase [Terrilactibacillus sp. S3-3]|nr:nitroreductase [Terrilactibacillus sp. S3-3]
MDTIEAIHTRRSIRKVKEVEPKKETILKLLESARWAPNHFNTEPWRFTVLTGEGRRKLGDAYGKINQEKVKDSDDSVKEAAYEKGMNKAFRAPVIIVVSVEPSDKGKVKEVEEICAAACAVQNILLSAHDLGLGAMWRTGDPTYTEIMKQSFGTSENGTVLGFSVHWISG